MKMSPGKRSAPFEIYQIKVTLKASKPPIWRRILVTSDTSLQELHHILQIVMGWEDYHLHMFDIGGQVFGDPDDDEYGDFGTKAEWRYKLNQVVPGPGSKFEYEYDFGDSWVHIVQVEKVLPEEEGVQYPVCVKGKRSCPPEDVGGIWGYQEFLEAMQDPDHPEHEEYTEWIGDEFDPEAFDLEEINAYLRQMTK
jgi:hypothetical protein